MKRIWIVLMTLTLLLSSTACGQKEEVSAEETAPTWQEQYDLGIRYLSEGKYEEAILAFTAVINVEPNYTLAYLGRADAYIGSGETAETLSAALADYKKAIELEQGNVTGWLGLADVYIRQSEFDRAEEVLREALTHTGEDSRIQEKLAEMDGGNITDSSGFIRKVTEYDADGNIQYTMIYRYHQGREASVTTYTADGSQISHIDVVYNEQGYELENWGAVYSDGALDKAVYEVDDQGRRTKETLYSPEGEIMSYSLYEYNEKGLVIKETSYDTWGFISCRVNTWGDDNRLDHSEFYSESGQLLHYMEFADNTVYYYDADGTLTYYIVELYDDNGEYIGSEDYDGDDNLISSTVVG